MNSAQAFLRDNWQLLQLAESDFDPDHTCLMLTPRFRTSSHVVFLVFAAQASQPHLVVKIPRLRQADQGLEREARNLAYVQGLRDGGFASVPRLLAFASYGGRRILVQSALRGRRLEPALVRVQPEQVVQMAAAWLREVQHPVPLTGAVRDAWFESNIQAPLRYFETTFPLGKDEERAWQTTRDQAARLQAAPIPSVLEHGDFSHPNVMWLDQDQIGVVDWELATPQGLPGYDLFFMLTFVAFSRQSATERAGFVDAFRQAFFGPEGWAQSHILRYAQELGLGREVLPPLFVVTWARYMANLLSRIGEGGGGGVLDDGTAAWLRGNRYYALWRYAVEHVDEISWA